MERTLFMLDWLENPDLRRRCHAGLNKSEQRHALTASSAPSARAASSTAPMKPSSSGASGLSLAIAAIVWWNSTYLADAVDHLRSSGEPPPERLLAHTSPVGWEHIAVSSDFLWDHAAAVSAERRPLRLGRQARRAA